MKKPAAVVSAIFFISVSIAQQGLNKGKIFTTNAVLDGFIIVSIYDQTPQEFKFSTIPNGPFQTIDAKQISKVQYDDGVTFEKHFVTIPVMSRQLLERTLDDYQLPENIFKGNVFIEKKLSGAVSLYQLIDNYGFSHFFFHSSEDSGVVYLPFKTYVQDGEVKYDYSFKNLINYLVQKWTCNINKFEMDALRYELNPLIRVFKKINDCQGVKAVDYQKENGVKWSGGIVGGMVSGYMVPGINSAKWHRSLDPKFGFYVSLSPKHNLKGYAAGLEITTDFHNAETDSITTNSFTKGKQYFSRTAINFSPFAKFFLSQDKTISFALIGLNVNSALSSKLRFEYVANGIAGKTESAGNFNSFYYMFFLGVGVELNKISLEARYSSSLSKENKNNFFGILATVRLF